MILNELGKLHSVEEISALLSVEEQTVYKWVREGKLKALKLAGTTLRVPDTELEKFILQALYYNSKGVKSL
ncbi:helix-turn-helix domain-containing protein [Paenibacillus sp. YPG26]|uniref:helix-turn-helix domain-containing protein n=1 Tax=Paenibacillus sp. YPG26 TaxID=2878915 RepID=UPI0020423390|nr:helix-turn-helix domain-containing protein [Paenibacillus sp. YPG26]USB33901.1 helix-turn-helix domain-containing protein [Paenibacillus sp. YPG26]